MPYYLVYNILQICGIYTPFWVHILCFYLLSVIGILLAFFCMELIKRHQNYSLKHYFVGATWGLIIAFAFERLSWPLYIHSSNTRFIQSIICLSIYTLCTLMWLIMRKKFINEKQKFFYEFEKHIEPEDLL